METDPSSLLASLCLSEKAVSEIFPLCEVRGFPEGDAIDLGNSIFKNAPFIVQSGLVGSRFKNINPSTSILDIFGPKALLGEAVFFGDVHTVDFICETPVKVLALPTKEILMLHAKEPRFKNHVQKVFYWRYRHGECIRNIHKTQDTALRATFLLSHFVYSLMQSHSYEGDENKSAAQKEIDVHIKQSVLASHFEMSRTNFSQCLQNLESNGWLQLGYGFITFVQLPVWRAIYQMRRENKLFNDELFKKIEQDFGVLQSAIR